MKMGDGEILRSYREAKNHFKQVGILAELNCVSKQEMAKWLSDHGQKVAKNFFPKADEEAEAIEKVEDEETAGSAVERVDQSVESFYQATESVDPGVESADQADEATSSKCVLSADQAYSVAEFIDVNLFDAIRSDTDWDSIQALKNIIYAYEEMCKVSGYIGLTENYEQDGKQKGEQ